MIEALLFDLDNTLYSAKYELERKAARRNLGYISNLLGLSLDDAAEARRNAVAKYGATLVWLIAEKGFTDIDGYYAEIHPPGEEADLPENPGLRAFFENLTVPFGILTNSPREHADRILTKLGVADLCTRIFDMRWNGLVGKPHQSAFLRALDAMGTSAKNTLFVDDYPSYVEGYLKLGGLGVLIDEDDRHRDYPHTRIIALEEIPPLIAAMDAADNL